MMPLVVIVMITVIAIAVLVAPVMVAPAVVASAMMMIVAIVMVMMVVMLAFAAAVLGWLAGRARRIWDIRRAGSFGRVRCSGARRLLRAGYVRRIGLGRSGIIGRNAARRCPARLIFRRRR